MRPTIRSNTFNHSYVVKKAARIKKMGIMNALGGCVGSFLPEFGIRPGASPSVVPKTTVVPLSESVCERTFPS